MPQPTHAPSTEPHAQSVLRKAVPYSGEQGGGETVGAVNPLDAEPQNLASNPGLGPVLFLQQPHFPHLQREEPGDL